MQLRLAQMHHESQAGHQGKPSVFRRTQCQLMINSPILSTQLYSFLKYGQLSNLYQNPVRTRFWFILPLQNSVNSISRLCFHFYDSLCYRPIANHPRFIQISLIAHNHSHQFHTFPPSIVTENFAGHSNLIQHLWSFRFFSSGF